MSAPATRSLLEAFGPDICDVAPDPTRYTAYGGALGGRPAAVLRPRTTHEVQAIVRHCLANRIPMIPQGGLTGLAGGAVPRAADEERAAIISLARLSEIREIDAASRTISVGAGCTVDAVESAAMAHGLSFPLSIGSSGTAEIGGVLSTNAGGIRSWRRGSARQLTLGIEAVLADGSLWSAMSKVPKGNRGIDVGQLLIGSEGCIGIISGAVLRLAPRPQVRETALIAVTDTAAAIALFAKAEATGDLDAFEMLSARGVKLVFDDPERGAPPVPLDHPWFVLAEWCRTDGTDIRPAIEALLADAMTLGFLADAVLAASERERVALWRIRETHGAACRRFGEPVQHDVSVPLSALGAFLDRACALADRHAPDCLPVPICHVGDGNVHFDLLTRREGGGANRQDLAALRRALHDLAESLGGTFSAEHGIGTVRADELRRIAPPGNYAAMRAIKAALDPHGLMNPGKVLQ